MANVVDRLGGASSSLAFKAPCRLATTAAITLEDFQTIDGVLPTSSEHVDLRRILVRHQSDSADNGVYIMSDGAWVRTKDFDGANDFRQGTRVFVWGGSTQSGTYVVTSSMDPATFDFDTDDITFAAVGTFDQETASLGISSGGKVSFDSDDVTITHSSSALAFAGAGAGYTFDNGVTLSSGLTVSGAVALSSAVTMSGAVTLSSAVSVTGALTASSAASVAINGTLTTTAATVNGALTSTAITASGLITGSAGVAAASSFTSSGNINAVSGTTVTVGGVAGKAILLYGSTTWGIYGGSSAPAIAAGQGSIYLRTDGGSSLTRLYINNAGSTTWVGVLTTA